MEKGRKLVGGAGGVGRGRGQVPRSRTARQGERCCGGVRPNGGDTDGWNIKQTESMPSTGDLQQDHGTRSARPWFSCTGMGSARRVPCSSTRPTGADAMQVMSENPYRLARDIRGHRDEARYRQQRHGPGARRREIPFAFSRRSRYALNGSRTGAEGQWGRERATRL